MSTASTHWSLFQRLSTSDRIVILIVIAIFCANWPASFVAVVLGMLIAPLWMTYRVIETSLRNLT